MASTFPASNADEIPSFVRDLVVALKRYDSSLFFSVLAPHHQQNTRAFTRHADFDEYRFSYFWPKSVQRLAGAGIMPTIERNRAFVLLVPFLFVCEFVALFKLARRLRPCVIYAHWFTPQGINAAIVSMLTGIPWVLTTHASDVSILSRMPVLGSWIVRKLLPRASAVTAVSTGTLGRARRFFSENDWAKVQERIRIIPMGVSDELREYSGSAGQGGDGVASGAKRILFLGRLVEKKGIPILLKAFSLVRSDQDQLVIAGSGPERDLLEAMTAELGLQGSIDFVGFVSGDAKRKLLMHSDVVVVPSVETRSGDAEGLPVVVLEALALGKVCIATSASGAGDIIEDGVNGFLVPDNDVEALGRALRSALALPSASLELLSARARSSSARVLWPEIAKQHHEFLFTTKSNDCT